MYSSAAVWTLPIVAEAETVSLCAWVCIVRYECMFPVKFTFYSFVFFKKQKKKSSRAFSTGDLLLISIADNSKRNLLQSVTCFLSSNGIKEIGLLQTINWIFLTINMRIHLYCEEERKCCLFSVFDFDGIQKICNYIILPEWYERSKEDWWRRGHLLDNMCIKVSSVQSATWHAYTAHRTCGP